MADRPPRIIVVGAGISGLSAAHHVQERALAEGRAVDLTVLESAPRPGGVIHTVQRDGFLLDAGPDNFVTNKPWAVDLVRRLGLADELLSTSAAHRSALVVRRGRLLPIPEGFLLMAPTRITPMLFSPLFSWRAKMRMALEPLVPARRENRDESLASFVTRRLGREALERLVQPLVGGIYSADPETLSVRATLPRFLDMETEQGSVVLAMRRGAKGQSTTHTAARYSLFVTLRDGLSTLIEALVQRIGTAHVRCACPVDRITRASAGPDAAPAWTVHLADGATLHADGVILACPTHQAAAMLRELDAGLARQLDDVEYSSSAVVHFAVRRRQIAHPLDAFGFVVPHVEGRNILAASFSSVKYAGRAPEGCALLRAFLGGALQPQVLERDDAGLVSAARLDLEPLLGLSGEPLFTTVHRWPRSMAQYKVGHLDRVAQMRQRLARHRTLAVAGNGYEGVGIPDCVRDGERAAEQVFDALRGTPRAARASDPPLERVQREG